MKQFLTMEECEKLNTFFNGGYKLVTGEETYEYSSEERILSVQSAGSDIAILSDNITVDAIKRGKLVKY